MDGQKQQNDQNVVAGSQPGALIPEVQKSDSKLEGATTQPASLPAKPAQSNQGGDTGKATTDADAQALLATFNMQNPQKPERKLPIGLIITVATLIILAILASTVMGYVNKNKSATTDSTNTNTSGQTDSPTNNTSNQINNDAKSCANPEVALSEC